MWVNKPHLIFNLALDVSTALWFGLIKLKTVGNDLGFPDAPKMFDNIPFWLSLVL